MFNQFLAVVTPIVYNYCVVVWYSSSKTQKRGIVFGNIWCFVVPNKALMSMVVGHWIKGYRTENPHYFYTKFISANSVDSPASATASAIRRNVIKRDELSAS